MLNILVVSSGNIKNKRFVKPLNHWNSTEITHMASYHGYPKRLCVCLRKFGITLGVRQINIYCSENHIQNHWGRHCWLRKLLIFPLICLSLIRAKIEEDLLLIESVSNSLEDEEHKSYWYSLIEDFELSRIRLKVELLFLSYCWESICFIPV